MVIEYGAKSWTKVAQDVSENFPTPRSGKQCRERWHNHLNPKIHNGNWLPEEEEIIFKFTKIYGTHWSKIARMLQGRTENAIKNYFYSTVRKNIRRVNKKLILREKINGSIKELMKRSDLSELIFCNSSQSLKMAVKLSKEIKLNGESEGHQPSADSQELVTIPVNNQEEIIDQSANILAWRQYYQYFQARIYWASQVQSSYFLG